MAAGGTRNDLRRRRPDSVADPSNEDEQFERVRIRRALGEAGWLDPKGVAASAANLADADAALHWATTQEWNRAVADDGGAIVYRPSDAPREIRRRIVRRAVLKLATEGKGAELRGRELDRVLAAVASGRKATVRGVLCSGGPESALCEGAATQGLSVEASRIPDLARVHHSLSRTLLLCAMRLF